MFGSIVLLALFGLIVGLLAKNRGRSFGIWFIYGALLFVVALIHVLSIKDDSKKCPKCQSKVDIKATVCKYCRYKFNQHDFKKIEVKKQNEEVQNNRMFLVLIIIGVVLYFLVKVIMNGHY